MPDRNPQRRACQTRAVTPTPDPEALPERNETPAERMDRNWVELLQELRVLQTGTQILAGFLLILPFQPAFAELSLAPRIVYLSASGLTVITTILVLAPVSAHRLLFRRGRKAQLVDLGDRMARLGLASLALSLACVMFLIFTMVLGLVAGAVAAAVVLIMVVMLWQVLPLTALLRR